MSLKAGFILFYVTFLSVFIWFSVEIGASVLNIDREQIANIQTVLISTETNPLLAFFELLFDVSQFFAQAFGILLTLTVVDPTYFLLNVFLILPLTIVFGYIIIEVIRGVGG